MPRKHLYRTSEFAYHVTNRSNNKEWFYIPIEECWEIFCYILGKTSAKYGVYLHQLVLMSNHYHLLLSTPDCNIDVAVQYFQSQVARIIQSRANRINHIMGTRYKWTVLDSPYSLAYVYKYICRNPVRAGIAEKVEDYRFSSLYKDQFPTAEGFNSYWKFIPRTQPERLKWLNVPTPKEQEELIGRALRRCHFKFSSHSNLQPYLRDLRANYGIESSF